MKLFSLANATLAIVTLSASAAMGAAPRGVSPGAAAGVQTLGASCPTFSWTATAAADGYELVVYRIDSDGEIEPRVRTRVPAGASSWSPAAVECPESGDRFAWSVRALTVDGPSPWSEALLFATPEVPSDDEVRRALGVLERYRTRRTVSADSSERIAEMEPEGRAVDPIGPGVAESPRPNASTAEDEPLTAPSIGASPPPAVVAPADPAFGLDSDLELGGFIFKDGIAFIHNDGGATYGNTAVGLNALVSATVGPSTGSRSTALGNEAMRYTTTGYLNTAIGDRALRNNTTGSRNTAVGTVALQANSSGYRNTAVGEQALWLNTTGSRNTAVGENALLRNDVGISNTALGQDALYANTSASYNTAVGQGALRSATTGSNNTALGRQALWSLTSGSSDTAIGVNALASTTTGRFNTGVGESTLFFNTEGESNTAVGEDALVSNTTGNLNTGVGHEAGKAWTTGAYNIALGHGAVGVAGESGTIRIGGGDLQVATYIEGISGATAAGGNQVFVNSDDKLGILTSSRRFKQDIEDLEAATEHLLELRPVRFRYKGDSEDRGDAPIEYGLIAEEVAEIFPELVVWDDEGEPYSVRYHLLAPLLLDEIQKQRIELELLRSRADEAAIRERDHEAELSDLRRRADKWTRKGRGR